MAIAAITIDCNDKGSFGGIRKVYFATASGVADTAFTRSGGQITAATISGTFVEIQTHDEAIMWETASERAESGNIVDVHTITVPVPNFTTEIRNQVEQYKGTCELVCLLEDNGDPDNDNFTTRWWMLGTYAKRRVKLTNIATTTGTALNDAKSVTLTFTCRDIVGAYEYTGATPS